MMHCGQLTTELMQYHYRQHYIITLFLDFLTARHHFACGHSYTTSYNNCDIWYTVKVTFESDKLSKVDRSHLKVLFRK